MIEMPKIGVMSSKVWPGAKNLSDQVRPLLLVSWRELWTEQWLTDAHFITYYAVDTGQTQFPRCTKVLLPKLRMAGGDLRTRLLVLDYDRPYHEAWTADALADWLAQLAEASEECELAWRWNVLYTTTHGARLVYVLDEAIPVDQAERHHRWLTQTLREAGIMIDDTNAAGVMSNGTPAKNRYPTSDWTCCFRLPYVMRDNKPTWEQEVQEFLEQPEQVISVEALGELQAKAKDLKADVEDLDYPIPDLDDAMGLISALNPKTKRYKTTEWAREAKRRLKGRQCYDCLFKHETLAEEGSRDTTLMQYVGEATTLLYHVEKDGERITTPDHLFGLFLDPVLQLDPDDDTPDWTVVLWRHILYCWAREEAEERLREEQEEARANDALGLLDCVVAGMREWCSDIRLFQGDAEAREFAFGHLIAGQGRNLHVMRSDGWYDPMPVTKSMLIPRIRALGMDNLIPIKVPTKSGEGYQMAQPGDLINQYATAVCSVSGQPASTGAWISSIDKQDAKLYLPLYYRRVDIPPTFDKRVDEWLRAFFRENYDEGCNWIGWALAVEEGPICSLSIKGEQGCGKKMLVQGLAECFSNEHSAGAETLTGDFQPALLTTPILQVDEGFPKSYKGKHPADMFRELVGGGTRFVNQKFRAPVETRNPVRVIFTANNLTTIKTLVGNRDLSPEDRNALAIRIMHFDIGAKASLWLRRRGGANYTKGWICGDGGAQGNYTVAKHFLWLYENKRRPKDSRLLVEGNGNVTLMDEMRIMSGSAPIVIEALLRMIEKKTKTFQGMTVEDGKLYVLTSEVLQFFRDNLAKSVSEKLTAQRVGHVFKGLVKKTTQPQILRTRPHMGRKRWHEVDLMVLQRVAAEDGWRCERLDALIDEQERRGIL